MDVSETEKEFRMLSPRYGPVVGSSCGTVRQ